jgi:hypothetical protein
MAFDRKKNDPNKHYFELQRNIKSILDEAKATAFFVSIEYRVDDEIPSVLSQVRIGTNKKGFKRIAKCQKVDTPHPDDLLQCFDFTNSYARYHIQIDGPDPTTEEFDNMETKGYEVQ